MNRNRIPASAGSAGDGGGTLGGAVLTVAGVVEILDRLLEIFGSDSRYQDVFKSEIRWLEHRKNLWSRPYWLVGLAGTTSVGKSTILNAILGSRMLPEGVRPTTNCGVFCRSGTRKRAIFRFADDTVKCVEDDPSHTRSKNR